MVAYERKFIEKLKSEIIRLKWDAISKDERVWAMRAYRLLWWDIKWEKEFKSDYIDFVERGETKWMNENMPFSDY